MNQYTTLREQAYEANMEIPRFDLAVFTWGNVSACDRGLGVFAIKPSGVPYDRLSPEDMVVLDLEGKVVEGRLRPSSDTPTHLILYREWTGIGGIIHTHSTHATAWAQARRPVPIYGTTHADYAAVDIPCVPLLTEEQIESNYELETGRSIVDHFRALHLAPDECPMTVVAGHGPFAWGKDAAEAVYHAVVLEQIARMAWMTESLAAGRVDHGAGSVSESGGGQVVRSAGGSVESGLRGDRARVSPAQRLPDRYIRKHYERKHGSSAYYGQE